MSLAYTRLPSSQFATENECMKVATMVIAIIYTVLQVVVGPFELVVTFMFAITTDWLNLALAALFGLAAVSKLVSLILAYYATCTSTANACATSTYSFVFTAAAALNTGSVAFMIYGSIRYIFEFSFVFLHIYFWNFLLLAVLLICAWIYVLSKQPSSAPILRRAYLTP